MISKPIPAMSAAERSEVLVGELVIVIDLKFLSHFDFSLDSIMLDLVTSQSFFHEITSILRGV